MSPAAEGIDVILGALRDEKSSPLTMPTPTEESAPEKEATPAREVDLVLSVPDCVARGAEGGRSLPAREHPPARAWPRPEQPAEVVPALIATAFVVGRALPLVRVTRRPPVVQLDTKRRVGDEGCKR